MLITEIIDYARRMYAQAGPKAIAIAAQRARACEEDGDTRQAQDWRRIQIALMERAGPSYS